MLPELVGVSLAASSPAVGTRVRHLERLAGCSGKLWWASLGAGFRHA